MTWLSILFGFSKLSDRLAYHYTTVTSLLNGCVPNLVGSGFRPWFLLLTLLTAANLSAGSYAGICVKPVSAGLKPVESSIAPTYSINILLRGPNFRRRVSAKPWYHIHMPAVCNICDIQIYSSYSGIYKS